MENKVHTLLLDLDWKLINLLSQVDRFDASWGTIEKREGRSLKQLKIISTVLSVGASTRIEGSNMSDEEVENLLKNIDISKLEDRDSQEVVGYFETLDLISESFQNIEITEGTLKNLHNVLMRYSQKDEWHKGDYKKLSNVVEAIYPDGQKHTIFQTTEAGFPTQEAMQQLIEWYKTDSLTHPLVKCAVFAYEFLSIHPFQDGNGRLSRLLASLLMLKNGYNWIQYISFEHEIESRKTEYYRVLRNCQSQRPNENVSEWIIFFFDSIKNIQEKLMRKLEISGTKAQLSPREKSIIIYIENNPGCQSKDISEKLSIPNPTVKKMLSELYKSNLIEKHGAGAGTNYTMK
jgi:Fic family protein